MPNRREPLTYKMVLQAYENLKSSPESLDSLHSVLYDWMVLGMVTGFRKSEWCQTRQASSSFDIIRNIDNTPKAFVLSDFTFEDRHGVRIDNSPFSVISDAAVLKIRWRFQKNGDNGQILS